MANIQVYDIQGQVQGGIALSSVLDQKELSPITHGIAIRVMRQNIRQGTVGCKARGDVAFSNKKPWKQKGTGRARAGSRRSPLWRKGGVTFGPQPRVRELSFNKKQRSVVFNNLFFSRLQDNKLFCLDGLGDMNKPSTKSVMQALKRLSLAHEPVVVFLPWEDDITQLSFRNIPNVTLLSFDQPNVKDLTQATHWVFLKRDIELFNAMVEQWN